MTEMTKRAETQPRRFRPYPAYRDSSIEWLGEIPDHWEVKRLSWLTKCLDGKRIPLNSEQRGRMKGEHPYYGANSILDYVDQWLFDEELVLLGEDGAPFFDRSRPVAFRVTGKIWVNNHAHVLRPQATIDGAFLTHALNCVDYRAFINGSTRDKLTQGDMGGIPIQCPRVNEQRAIAEFLDRETAKIDALVARKERLIELLQEKRTALITCAVTRGLDPNVPLKDSGIEWLGENPSHWVAWKATHGFGKIGSGTTPKSTNPEYYDGDFAWVTTSELRENVIVDSTKKVTSRAVSEYPTLRMYPKGTLLFAMYGATIGRLGILGIPATVNQACAALAEPVHFIIRFVFYWLQMRRPTLIVLSAGGGQPNLSQDDLRQLRIPAPPLDEQRAIADVLDHETARIDALIAKVYKAIDHLNEFRTALISRAVTGKIDVREDAF